MEYRFPPSLEQTDMAEIKWPKLDAGWTEAKGMTQTFCALRRTSFVPHPTA